MAVQPAIQITKPGALQRRQQQALDDLNSGKTLAKTIGVGLVNPIAGIVVGWKGLRDAKRRAEALNYFQQERLKLDKQKAQEKVDAAGANARLRGLELAAKTNLFENPLQKSNKIMQAPRIR